MSLTIGRSNNYINYFKMPSKKDELEQLKNDSSENLEETNTSKTATSSGRYHPNGVIQFDRDNLTAYMDCIKLDKNFMDIMTLQASGASNAQILSRISMSYEDKEAEVLKRIIGL